MIELGKSNGSVRLMYAGDIVRHTMCKAFLEVTQSKATHAAGVD